MTRRIQRREQAPTPAQRQWRWVGACAVGEAVGLLTANVLNLLVVPLLAAPGETSPLVVSATMVAAGAVEGACLGLAQWAVLRRWLPAVGAVRWTAATSVGFAAGWLMGAMSSVFEPAGEPGFALVIAVAALTGTMLGAAVGLAQAVVLWRHGIAAGRWLLLTALAWTLGTMVSYLGLSHLPVAWNAASVGITLATGACVGTVVGAVTGWPWRVEAVERPEDG